MANAQWNIRQSPHANDITCIQYTHILYIYIHFNDLYILFINGNYFASHILSLNSVNSFTSFCLASSFDDHYLYMYITFRIALVYTAFMQINNGPLRAYVISSGCFLLLCCRCRLYRWMHSHRIHYLMMLEGVSLSWNSHSFPGFVYVIIVFFCSLAIVFVNIWSQTNNHHTITTETKPICVVMPIALYVCLLIHLYGDNVRVYEFRWIVIFVEFYFHRADTYIYNCTKQLTDGWSLTVPSIQWISLAK